MTQLFQHPDYVELSPHWQRYKDLFEGKHSVVCRNHEYLWPHTQELVTDQDGYSRSIRAARERRTRYLNLPEIIVSLLTSFFFRERPILDEQAKAMLEEDESIENIDGKGTSVTGFIKDYITKNYLIYGRPIVLVDSFKTQANSEAERRALKLRPYWDLLDPLAVMDWDLESENSARIGQLNMLRHEYTVVRPRMLSTQPVVERFSDTLTLVDGTYSIIRDTIKLDDKGKILKNEAGGEEWQRVEVIPTQLEKIPVSFIDGGSWIDGACEECLRVHNLRSSKDNIEYYQAYQKIIISGVTTTEQMKALSENIIAFVPAGATWGAIEPVNTDGLEKSIQQAIDNTFKLGLNLGRTLPADSRAGQSEGSQQEEKTSTYSLIESSLDDIEVLANQALADYAMFRGKKDFEGRITLNREIQNSDFQEFVNLWNAFRDALKGSDIINRAALKKVIEKMELPIPEDQLEAAIEQAAGVKEIAQPNTPFASFLNAE